MSSCCVNILIRTIVNAFLVVCCFAFEAMFIKRFCFLTRTFCVFRSVWWALWVMSGMQSIVEHWEEYPETARCDGLMNKRFRSLIIRIDSRVRDDSRRLISSRNFCICQEYVRNKSGVSKESTGEFGVYSFAFHLFNCEPMYFPLSRMCAFRIIHERDTLELKFESASWLHQKWSSGIEQRDGVWLINKSSNYLSTIFGECL